MQTIEPNDKKSFTPGIDDEFDDLLDSEQIQFRPITKGLGFHHGKEDQRVAVTRKRAKSLNDTVLSEKKAITAMATQAAETLKSNRSTPSFDTESLETADLKSSPEFSQIYGKSEVEVGNSSSSQAVIEAPKEVKGSLVLRFLAWMVDLCLVGSVIGGLLIFSRLIGKYDFFEFFGIHNYVNLILLFTIYGAFYVIYFSIFEAVGGQSLGKKILGLRVTNNIDEEMKFSQTFVRANLSLLSVFLLGGPSLWGSVDKYSDTKVIKK